jgi:HAD superfamily hydrolase (TIGR01490 family)
MTSESSHPGRAAAFFDLDRTLIDVNSGTLYARYEYENGRISTRQLVTSFFYMGLYYLSLIDIEAAYNRALAHYRGEPSSALLARTRDWFERDVAHRLQPGGKAALEEHLALGHPRVLLTSSSPYMAQTVSNAWGLDGWIANRFPTDERGLLRGELEPPFCYGAGKVVRAERWALEHDVDLDASYFYTDSYSDLPMLERVGQPRVVQPDPRLRRVAAQRGWPILDWKSAPAAASA